MQQDMKSQFMQALTSRTTWTVVAMFIIGGTNAIASVIPVSMEPYIMGALGLLAMYFKVNPSQSYGKVR